MKVRRVGIMALSALLFLAFSLRLAEAFSVGPSPASSLLRRANRRGARVAPVHMQDRNRRGGWRGGGRGRGSSRDERRGGAGNIRYGFDERSRREGRSSDGGGMSTDYVKGRLSDPIAVLDERLDRFVRAEMGADLSVGTDWRPKGLGRRHFDDEDLHPGKVQRGRMPRDLHTISELGVLISTLETVAGLPPVPPSLPVPSPLKIMPPRSRPHGDYGAEDASGTEVTEAAAGDMTSMGVDMPSDEGGSLLDVADLKGMKVAELKEACKELGLKVSGKKDELIERLRAHHEDARAATSPASDSHTAASASVHNQADSTQGLAIGAETGADMDQVLSQSPAHEVEGGVGEDSGTASGPIIKYLSTRGNPKARWRGRLAEALREGVPHDGGLLVPTSFPDLRSRLPTWAGLSFPNLALEMARIWMGKEWHEEFLEEVFLHDAFASYPDRVDPLPVRRAEGSNGVHILELFHGPSGGPQDSITLPLARVLSHIVRKRKGRATVVTGFTNALEALSIANACKEAPPLSSFFVAPLDLQPSSALETVCQMQSKTSQEAHGGADKTHVAFMPSDANAIAEIVREVLCDTTVRRQYSATTLDGTNVAHVLLAVANYVHGYLQLRPACDGPIKVAMSAGDYTQASAAYYARLCGVPIDSVITASPVVADDLRTVDEAVRDGGGQSDAMTPGLERLAFEFCGRDPGRIAEAAAGGTLGIQQLVDTVCPPDFVRVTVGDDEADKAASATTTPLCEEARRALAAAKHVGGDMPVLVVAPKRAGGSVDDGTGPAGTISGSAAAPGNREVLVSSVISVRDLVSDNLPPYAPLEVPGPQAVAALNHLKRLGPRARNRDERRKVVDLSDLLMTSLLAESSTLSIKDTCLALNSVADAVKNRASLEGTGSDAQKSAVLSRKSVGCALLAALRRRLEDHMSRAPLRFSGRLLGLALNALAKAREFDDIGEEEETRLFDLAERLVLIKAEEADAFDMVSMSHIAHAYTAVITRPAPPLGRDPHSTLPAMLYNDAWSGSNLDRGHTNQAWEASGEVTSASEGLALLEELEMWATDNVADGSGAHAEDEELASSFLDQEVEESKQGSETGSVPLSAYGPQGYGVSGVRDASQALQDVSDTAGNDGGWRQFGRYGRMIELIASQVMTLDPAYLQAQGLAHLVNLLGISGKLRQDKALYTYVRGLVLGTPGTLFGEVPFALSLTINGVRESGVIDEDVHRHLATAVDEMSERFVNDKILLELLQGLEALDATHSERRLLMATASRTARPLDKVYRNHDVVGGKSEWLRRATAKLKLVAASLALNKWTPSTLAQFAWCARRSTAEDTGLSVLPGEEPRADDASSADHEFEAYVSRALINTDPDTLDGKTAAALLAYHVRDDHVIGETQARQDALVLAYIAEAISQGIDGDLVSVHDWVTILQAVTQLRSKHGAAGGETEAAVDAREKDSALDMVFAKAARRLRTVGLVLGSAAADGAMGGEISLSESVTLLHAFAHHSGADADVLAVLTALVTGEPAAQLATAPRLLGRLSSSLVALHSRHSPPPAAAALLEHVTETLAHVPPPDVRNAHGGVSADLLAQMSVDVASLPASQESRAALAQLSQVCRGRAPNLFGRQAARTILSAFARADLEDDAIFVHLSRIARGRAALPTNSDYAGNESGQPSSGSMSAADELYKPAKRGLY